MSTPSFGIEDMSKSDPFGRVRETSILNSCEYWVDIPGLMTAGSLRILAHKVQVPGFGFTIENREEGNLQIGYAMDEQVEDLAIHFYETINADAWGIMQEWRNKVRVPSGMTGGNEGGAVLYRFRAPAKDYKLDVAVTHLDRMLKPAQKLKCTGCIIKSLTSYMLDDVSRYPVSITMVCSCDMVEPFSD